ncbi:MAG: RNA polymerase sigma-70 factor [Bacteroidia bacterium]|nr:RNA polymerase sigma-70 factor [Bacteroidia bacterium]
MEERFKQLYIQQFEALCRFANFYCGDPQLAQDTVQQVFLKLWETNRDITLLENPTSYLYTSVRNQVLNDQRRKQVVTALENEDASVPHIAEQLLQGKELKRKIEYLIGQLPEKRQYIFRLSREDKKSYKEIATLLDISPKTVENQIGKALKFLKEKIF